MTVPRLWVGVPEAAKATGRTEKAIYEQIRTGKFPFEVRRSGTAILISARDLGLLDPLIEAQKCEAQDNQVEVSQAAA